MQLSYAVAEHGTYVGTRVSSHISSATSVEQPVQPDHLTVKADRFGGAVAGAFRGTGAQA